MSRRLRWGVAGLAAAAVAGALLYPAAADWLVTRGGSRIETAGPWRVEGRLVVFKKPDGSLVSLRLSDVDLEGSRDLTREMDERAKEAAEAVKPEAVAKASEKRPSIARLTEADLPPVGSGDAAAERGDSDAGAGAPGEKEKPEALQVASWREVGGAGGAGLEFVGTVRNVTDKAALSISVDVVLSDEAGKELGRNAATVSTTALPPGQSASFHASFPGIFSYGKVEFKVGGQLVLTSRPGATAPEEAQAAGEAPPPGSR